ncbi:MAG: Gfo/Idh/MocA family oxidoreductase [Fimbriimonadaceae bacterium]|nr:Gfo/Idh/MocA family oxidoreductase [Fimbriimonadaceae bacterium]
MRFGVIGWGLRKSIAKLAHRPDLGDHLVALADPDPAALADFSAFAGPEARTFPDVADLWSQPLDAVFVLSPDDLHETHGLDALSRQIPTYLEKPMAITVAGCDRLLAAARTHQTLLYVGHNMRHFPVIRRMKALIDAGTIGRVVAIWCRHFVSYGGDAYFTDWHADRRRTHGLLLQKGAHDIDVIHYLAGSYATRVTAMGQLAVYGDPGSRRPDDDPHHKAKFRQTWPPEALRDQNPVVDVEDLNAVLLQLGNGVQATYQQCHFAPDAWRNYTVIGAHGRLENFGDVPSNARIAVWNRAHPGYAPEPDAWHTFEDETGTHGGADARIIDEFRRALRGETELAVDSVAARMSVAAGIAATDSLRNGNLPVKVTPYTPAS